jgi:hypothetical protein
VVVAKVSERLEVNKQRSDGFCGEVQTQGLKRGRGQSAISC